MDKIPIQANFYPLPSMAFLQDKSTRLTLVSAQSNGVAGLHQGNCRSKILVLILGIGFWEGKEIGEPVSGIENRLETSFMTGTRFHCKKEIENSKGVKKLRSK